MWVYIYIYVHEGARPPPLGRLYMYITNDMPNSASLSRRAELRHKWECHGQQCCIKQCTALAHFRSFLHGPIVLCNVLIVHFYEEC